MKIVRVLPLVCLIVQGLSACKTGSSDSGLRDDGVVSAGRSVSCRFDVPYSQGDAFEVTARLDGTSLTNVRGVFVDKSRPRSPRTLAEAPLAKPAALDERWSKKLADQDDDDRSIRAFEKQHFALDKNGLHCFDISGVGPKKEDYLCVPKGGNALARETLWVSDFRYEKDLNVLGTACR